ncbi:MAG: DUF4358 domain-containing protein [Acetanaerobacterium sp.]
MVQKRTRTVKILAALMAAALLLCACSGGADGAGQKEPPADEIAQRIIDTCTFDELIKLEDTVLYNQYGDLSEDIVVDAAVYASTMVTADEVCVIRVADEDDVQAARAAIETRLEELADKFTGYREEELPKIQNAVIETHGTYLLMTTATDGETAAAEFEKMF